SFNVQAQVPQDAPMGTTLYVTAKNVDPNNPNNTDRLGAGYILLIKFTVGDQPVSTSTPTPAPTPTSASNNSAKNNGQDVSGLLVLLGALAALVVILLVMVVLLLVLLVRGRRHALPPFGGGWGAERSSEAAPLSGPQGQEWR